MKTKPFYLVVDPFAKTAKRVRQSWPDLASGEIVVRLVLEIPEDRMPHIQEISVEDLDAIRIGAEAVPVDVA